MLGRRKKFAYRGKGEGILTNPQPVQCCCILESKSNYVLHSPQNGNEDKNHCCQSQNQKMEIKQELPQANQQPKTTFVGVVL